MSDVESALTSPAVLPLRGITVVEMAGGIAGALAGRMLAGYGAEVVRIEGLAGDPLRRMGPLNADGTSPAHLYFNAGKSALAIDTATERGCAELVELLTRAGHLITDLDSGTREEIGLQPDRLAEQFPDLSVVSVTPYGESGPRRNWKATDLTSYASGGQMSLMGAPDREPLKSYGNQAECQAAFHVFAAVLQCELRVTSGGGAARVEISVQEVQASALEAQGPAAFNHQHLPDMSRRTGNSMRAIWSQYPCRDGYVGVFVNPPNLKAFFATIGRPELIARVTDEEFMDGELRELVAAWCAERTKREVFDAAVEHGSPLSYVAEPADLLSSPSIAATGFWVDVEQDGLGTLRVPGAPFTSTEMNFRTTAAPHADTVREVMAGHEHR